MDKTVIFLDIDGAVCPYERDWNNNGVYSLSDSYDYRIITNLRVPIAPHVEKMLALLTPDNAVWSSSWGDVSNTVNDELELPRYPVMMDTMNKLHNGKTHSLNRYLDDHPEIDHVILVEDEPYPVIIPHTTICTRPFTGITEEDVCTIMTLLLPVG